MPGTVLGMSGKHWQTTVWFLTSRSLKPVSGKVNRGINQSIETSVKKNDTDTSVKARKGRSKWSLGNLGGMFWWERDPAHTHTHTHDV